MESIWTKGVNKIEFAPLKKDIKTEVLIIGGGITGILCGYELTRAGVECVIVEADRICGGVTGYTTAKITLQHGLIYDKIIKKYGVEKAQMYLSAQQEALERYKELCQNFDCDYKTQDAYVFSTDDFKEIEQEARAYQRLGFDAKVFETADLPFAVKGVLYVKEQAQFDPLKFCIAVGSQLKIYEKTKVISLFDGGAFTNKGRIFAKKIIVATHFPFVNKYGVYFLKMYQHRSYVIALKGAKIPNGMYVDADLKGLSFREYKGMLLLGGGSHRTGKNGGAWNELRGFANKNHPKSQEVAHWATQDCMTLDGIPYIGQYSKRAPHIFVATGFNKWGMTSSMAAARILSDAVMGRKNEFAEVFDPSRSIWHPQFAVNMGESLINMLTPTTPRCPHLGCALKYNRQEHSWDCPCHGSRFSEEGNLLENPATKDKRL